MDSAIVVAIVGIVPATATAVFGVITAAKLRVEKIDREKNEAHAEALVEERRRDAEQAARELARQEQISDDRQRTIDDLRAMLLAERDERTRVVLRERDENDRLLRNLAAERAEIERLRRQLREGNAS